MMGMGVEEGKQGLRMFFVFVKWATMGMGALHRRVGVGPGGGEEQRCVHCAGERGGQKMVVE